MISVTLFHSFPTVVIMVTQKTCCKLRNSVGENTIFSKDRLAVTDSNWPNTHSPYFLVQDKGELRLDFLLCLTASTAHMDDTAKFIAVSFIF